MNTIPTTPFFAAMRPHLGKGDAGIMMREELIVRSAEEADHLLAASARRRLVRKHGSHRSRVTLSIFFAG